MPRCRRWNGEIASAPYLSLPLARGVPRLCLSSDCLDQAQRQTLTHLGAPCGATATGIGLGGSARAIGSIRETPHVQFDIALLYSAPQPRTGWSVLGVSH